LIRDRGFNITCLDLSPNSLEVARHEASKQRVALQTVVGSAYQLPFDNESFDGVLLSDVLEHLHDLDTALAQVSRILKPRGVLVLDTIDRTWLSYIAMILVNEHLTGFIRPNSHDWRLFLRPTELERVCQRHGLIMGEPRVGVTPRNPFRLTSGFRAANLTASWPVNLFTGMSYL
jgi:2-polyprenyl-6-hydroxyphenyl methylase/3-demethylubiquinone-9 3-methyltransferase